MVIGIIALLISVLLPALNKARQSAKTAACLSNLRQIGFAINMYANANQTYLPINLNDNTTWAVLINRYMGGRADNWDPSKNPPSQAFRCPSAVMPDNPAAAGTGRVHYTSNPLLIPEINRDYDPSGGTFYLTKSYKLSKIKPYPTDVALVFDGTQMNTNARGGSAHSSAHRIDSSWLFGNTWYRKPSDTNAENPIALRTNIDDWGNPNALNAWADIRYRENADKAANLLFADGHAETIRRGGVKKKHLKAYKPN